MIEGLEEKAAELEVTVDYYIAEFLVEVRKDFK